MITSRNGHVRPMRQPLNRFLHYLAVISNLLIPR